MGYVPHCPSRSRALVYPGAFDGLGMFASQHGHSISILETTNLSKEDKTKWQITERTATGAILRNGTSGKNEKIKLVIFQLTRLFSENPKARGMGRAGTDWCIMASRASIARRVVSTLDYRVINPAVQLATLLDNSTETERFLN